MCDASPSSSSSSSNVFVYMKHITIISPDGNETKVARLDKQ